MAELFTFPSDLAENGNHFCKLTCYRRYHPDGYSGSADYAGVVTPYTGSAADEIIGSFTLQMPESGIRESANLEYTAFSSSQSQLVDLLANGIVEGGKDIYKNLANLFSGNLNDVGQFDQLNKWFETQKAQGNGLVEQLKIFGEANVKDFLANLIGLDYDRASVGFNQGVAWNPATRYAFSGVSARTFPMSWRLSPRNATEAMVIKDGLQFLRRNSHPKRESFFRFLYPNEWVISFFSRDEQNPFLFQTKRCVITSLDADYMDGQPWKCYEDGSPITTSLAINFQELEVLSAEDYGETPTTSDPGAGSTSSPGDE